MKLFTKTCAKDLPWLKMAIKTVKKFGPTDLEWTMVIEDADLPKLKEISGSFNAIGINGLWPESIRITDGYLRQQ